MKIPLILVTDPGKDPDDELTLILLKTFIEQSLVDLKCITIDLYDSLLRAQLTEGTLDVLGLFQVPIGIHIATKPITMQSYETTAPYLAVTSVYPRAETVLKQALEEAQDNSVTILVIAQMTSLSLFAYAYPDLFCKKVQNIVIMGGYANTNGEPLHDDILLPDTSANVQYDALSANMLYSLLQTQWRKPITFVTREAAYACKFEATVLDALAKTKHPVGIKVRDAAAQSIQHLWHRVNLEADDPAREKLPARCDRLWFINTFCNGIGPNISGSASIWPHIRSLNFYDPLALIAAVPQTSLVHCTPTNVTRFGITHNVIGYNNENLGIKNVPNLRSAITKLLIGSLSD